MTVPRVALGQSVVLQAKDHVRAGLAYAEHDKWEEAVREFEEAYALDPQVATLFDVGQARLQTKRYVAAADAFRRVLASRSDVSANQHQTAVDGLAKAVARIGHVEVVGTEKNDVVEIDGAAVDPRGVIDVDPGRHRLVLVRGGTRRPARQLVAEDGQRVRVSVKDEAAPGPGASSPGAPTAATNVVGEPPPAEARPVVGFVLGGLGIATVGVGAVLGVTALSRRSELADSCGTTKTCSVSDVDGARTRMAIADVTLGVGVLATVLGAYLILTRPSASVSVVAGPASGGIFAGLRSSFE